MPITFPAASSRTSSPASVHQAFQIFCCFSCFFCERKSGTAISRCSCVPFQVFQIFRDSPCYFFNVHDLSSLSFYFWIFLSAHTYVLQSANTALRLLSNETDEYKILLSECRPVIMSTNAAMITQNAIVRRPALVRKNFVFHVSSSSTGWSAQIPVHRSLQPQEL